jgi:hypothetical protein
MGLNHQNIQKKQKKNQTNKRKTNTKQPFFIMIKYLSFKILIEKSVTQKKIEILFIHIASSNQTTSK